MRNRFLKKDKKIEKNQTIKKKQQINRHIKT